MNIEYKISLDRYSPSQLIELHKDGVISFSELKASGRYYTAFGPELADYIWALDKDAKKAQALALGANENQTEIMG